MRHWLTLVVDDSSAASVGLGETAAEKLALFCADDGLLSAVDPDWLQPALDILIGLFRRIGLATNTSKTKLMTCHPATIQTTVSNLAYERRMTGRGESFRERQRRRVECPVCDKPMNSGSLKTHLQRIHGIDHPLTPPTEPDLGASAPSNCRVSFPPTLKVRQCPVPGCHGRSHSKAGSRMHFMNRHPADTICVFEEGGQPLPRCPKCDMHISELAMNRGHTNTSACCHGTYRRHRRALALEHRRASEVVTQALGQNLDKVEQFCYLGRTLDRQNSDWPALFKNLKKAKQKWALISRPLIRTGVSPKVVGMFCKAIVQAVLLCASET